MVEGFLTKFATGLGKNWKRRYFRLYAAASSASISSLNSALGSEDRFVFATAF